MKITAIQAKNFIGAVDVDVTLRRQVTLFCGKNHSGKSSLSEAVRMALTGEPSRVSLKKNYKQLVSDGAEVGYAVVEHDGGQSAITLPNGTHEHTGSRRPSELLPFVLDAQRFSKLDANERRQFLLVLSGISMTCHEVKKRMIERGCDAAKVEIIAQHMTFGSDAAHKEAQAKAREAKGAWRAITGETYGVVKAANWKALRPSLTGYNPSAMREALSRIDEQIEANAGKLGDMNGRAKRAAEQAGKLAGLRQHAGTYARVADKLQRDEAELKQWEAKIAEAGKSDGQRMPDDPTYTCPSCATVLRHDHVNGALVEYTAPPPVDHEAAGKLREYQDAAELMRRCVANGQRDLGAADASAKALAEIEDAGLVEAPNTGELDTLQAATDELKKQRAEFQKSIRELEDAERAAKHADQRTSGAASHHADVHQWETIAAALAPDGIPGQMLGEALGPVNSRLADSHFSTDWPIVTIAADMDITADGRAYALLSESERWRVDAMIAETIAHLSGEKLLVLDRVDVLDIEGREDLLFWLDDLASSGQIETALLFATLKAFPAKLPDNIEAVWIEGGRATTAGRIKAA
ncbi:AAA domain containing protein [uncultured Caudovirales phage]|uniref:AAA domain containing protein n=1 Tax=uncultured Caudovirales phage TaxID=2100421 RepID=A0A6J5PYS9_9CAUD|nr:AAA domain containing protein [uncultured Caudovirales phage]